MLSLSKEGYFNKMNYRAFSLAVLAFLAACDDSQENASESNFTPPAEIVAALPVVIQAAEPAQVKPPLTPEEAFNAAAPPDTVIDEKTHFDTTADGSVALADVSQKASAKRHNMVLDGKTIYFTARAGHLVTYDADKKNPEAAVFYTAYTRDDLPKEKRPVTFFWNGGPGSSSIWLHMGSWAPKRLKSDAPNIPESDYAKQPESFPFLDNDISLLGQSDLVFVDPPGAGYSAAIAPLKNRDLWGTDIDAKVVADFITRYNNVNGRQSSPKYLYGESYGGIRTPIVANLLQAAGTSRFEPDSSGKAPVVLSGYILNSPLVDYTSNCHMRNTFGTAAEKAKYWSCAGFIPSYAMTADYFHKSIRKNETKADFLTAMKTYTRDVYTPIFDEYIVDGYIKESEWENFQQTKPGKDFQKDLSDRFVEDQLFWDTDRRPLDLRPHFFQLRYTDEKGKNGFRTGRFDARMKVPLVNGETAYAADDYIDKAFLNQFKTYLPDFANYNAVSDYQPSNSVARGNWAWKRASQASNMPTSTPDILSALTYNPGLKLLILHGYQDIATPGFQTELDLEAVGLLDRIPVKWFEGGHMIYNDESSRPLLKKTLDQYYEGAPYDAEAAVAVQSMQQSRIVSAKRLVDAAAAN
ncbi:hypothetical protein M8997_007375 [Phyllobacterium sp. 21LDTY02-6]|uniref:S10 family serine carboxypeptidase-like protein n=1 Tax=Phyllobacterium sp. 21LDTY02-6 TaxID=2944903 RepID=UPI002020F711|nr:hypothetical protein [Phyllobacterium sp. 21LDTY02-6]MCO4316999.1 hypothetical protein [Phyllobacterium sp. 21LDTY02-6]